MGRRRVAIKAFLMHLMLWRSAAAMSSPAAERLWDDPGRDIALPTSPLKARLVVVELGTSPAAQPGVTGSVAVGVARFVKRSFDVAGATAFLLAGLPVILLIALTIKLDSPGPVLYRSQRVGRGGRPISVLKFRSMHDGSEQQLSVLRQEGPHGEEFEARFKIREDPRRTRVGRLLRRTSLDEVPQFWNVLRGDMSLVGPRPVVEEELDFYRGVPGGEVAYLSVRPGLTGLWQISGRSDTTYEERVLLDMQYVADMSTLLDLRILLRTPVAVVRGSGAY